MSNLTELRTAANELQRQVEELQAVVSHFESYETNHPARGLLGHLMSIPGTLRNILAGCPLDLLGKAQDYGAEVARGEIAGRAVRDVDIALGNVRAQVATVSKTANDLPTSAGAQWQRHLPQDVINAINADVRTAIARDLDPAPPEPESVPVEAPKVSTRRICPMCHGPARLTSRGTVWCNSCVRVVA